MKVDKKIIVVTGAGSGIGRELALLLLARGAKIAGADVNAAALAQTTALAESSDFAEFAVDITSRSAVECLPAKVIARFGAVDGIINNAGINLSSMGGFIAVPGQTMYCAAKAAVKLMSQGLASELIGTNVRVSVVFPGAIATKIRENSGLGTPAALKSQGTRTKPLPARKAAEMIVDAMERNAQNVFVGRDARIMDKLYRLSPSFAARTIARKMRSAVEERPVRD